MGTQLLFDGHSISSEADFHDAVERAARAAGFNNYGRNLDALWDVLTGILELPVEARWTNVAALRAGLGKQFSSFLSTFEQADQQLGTNFNFGIHS